MFCGVRAVEDACSYKWCITILHIKPFAFLGLRRMNASPRFSFYLIISMIIYQLFEFIK